MAKCLKKATMQMLKYMPDKHISSRVWSDVPYTILICTVALAIFHSTLVSDM